MKDKITIFVSNYVFLKIRNNFDPYFFSTIDKKVCVCVYDRVFDQVDRFCLQIKNKNHIADTQD